MGSTLSSNQAEAQAGVCMVSPIVTHIQAGIQRQLLLQTRELAKRGSSSLGAPTG